ncbi:hypothetical protein JTE90_008934 [Oedothorax gibbosus]|uniref:Orange domain-containing protein n=1 Tax=Oedothorax gibbosus TaxID=931172 RepID=A0AAV6UPM5_9ARAC|nr:hypothetical protein JTE90_008934 [Oedothorax gibbosus]
MPDVRDSSEESDLVATAAEDDRYAELLLAGFRACAREAIRFLLEEEGLSPNHPLPSGLNEHLLRQQCHLAGTLQNDSGVDFEESFLNCSTDGDTKSPKKRNCQLEGTLESDSSGVDYSESFLNCSTDGDTTLLRKRRRFENETDGTSIDGDEDVVKISQCNLSAKMTEDMIKSEPESVQRTEEQTSHVETKL